MSTYCGWKKSCITLDGWNPINNGISHLSTGAGFLPSTVDLWKDPPLSVCGHWLLPLAICSTSTPIPITIPRTYVCICYTRPDKREAHHSANLCHFHPFPTCLAMFWNTLANKTSLNHLTKQRIKNLAEVGQKDCTPRVKLMAVTADNQTELSQRTAVIWPTDSLNSTINQWDIPLHSPEK